MVPCCWTGCCVKVNYIPLTKQPRWNNHFEDAQSEIRGSPRVLSYMFAGPLLSRHGRLQLANWMCPKRKEAWQNWHINKIFGSFSERRQVHVRHEPLRMLGSGMGIIIASALFERSSVHPKDCSWRTRVDPLLDGLYRQPGLLAVTIARGQIWRSMPGWSKASNSWRSIPTRQYLNQADRSRTKYWYSTSLPKSPQKKKRRVMSIQDYDVLNNNEGIGFHALHAIATSKDTKHDKRLTSTREFIQEQANYSYCAKRHPQSDRPDRFLTTTMNFWFTLHRSMK